MKWQWSLYRQLKQSSWARGFSLLEQLIIVVIVGILCAIAGPSWIGLHQQQQVNLAQDQIQTMIKQAQHLAKVQRASYRFVIRQPNDRVEWGIARGSQMPIDWTVAAPSVKLDERQTTFRQEKDLKVWFVGLGDDGTVDGQLGRVTVCIRKPAEETECSVKQKCVIMSTLLGETRRGEWHKTLQDGKFNCY